MHVVVVLHLFVCLTVYEGRSKPRFFLQISKRDWLSNMKETLECSMLKWPESTELYGSTTDEAT